MSYASGIIWKIRLHYWMSRAEQSFVGLESQKIKDIIDLCSISMGVPYFLDPTKRNDKFHLSTWVAQE